MSTLSVKSPANPLCGVQVAPLVTAQAQSQEVIWVGFGSLTATPLTSLGPALVTTMV